MARDINDVVVVGFGGWSDVYALPTLGFGQTALPPQWPGIEYQQANTRLHYAMPSGTRLHYTDDGQEPTV